MMINVYSIIPLFSFIINMSLAAYVFAISKKNKLSQAYLIYTISIVLWEILEFTLYLHIPNKIRYIMFNIIPLVYISAMFFYMNFIFALTKKNKNLFYYIFAFILLSCMAVTIFSDLYIIGNPSDFAWGIIVTPGTFYYYIIFLGIIPAGLYCLYLTWDSCRNATNIIIKKQLYLIFWGFLLVIISEMFTNIIFPSIFNITPLLGIASSLSAIQSIFIFFAIIRYKFLSINIKLVAYDIFSYIDDGIIIINENFEIININNQAKNILGLRNNKSINRNINDIFPNNYKCSENYKDKEITISVNDSERVLLISQKSLNQTDIFIGKLIILKDITKNKTAEKALHESEDRYRLLLENINVPITIYNPEGIVLMINKTALELFGLPINYPGKTIHDLFPSMAELILLRFREVIETGEEKKFEDLIHIDSKDMWFWSNYQPIKDTTGKIIAIQIISNDITNRKIIEEQLKISEEKFSKAFHSSPVPMFINTLHEGKFIDVNESQIKQVHYTREEFIGNTIFDLDIFPDINEYYKFLKILKDEGKVNNFECDIKTKTDEIRNVIVYAEIIKIGGEDCIIATAIDITSRKQSQKKIQEQFEELEKMNIELSRTHDEVLKINERLAKEKERLSTTLFSIGEGVITIDNDGKIDLINRIAEDIIGFTHSEAKGHPVTNVLTIFNEETDEICDDLVAKVLTTGDIAAMKKNTFLINRIGIKRFISIIGAPIKDKQGNIIGAVLAFRDITERLNMESELLKASKIESLGIFAGGIAHDFNNLLTAILGNISIAKLTSDKDDKTFELLYEAEKATLRAKDLTRQLLTFSKGGAPIKQTTSIQDLLRDTIDFVLRGSNVKCEQTIPLDLWSAEIDEGQISQVIHNLILNANQSMPKGGIIFVQAENIAIDETSRLPLKSGDYIKISVKDQGIGIAKSDLKNIFDPFFTTKDKGSGLGLSVTYSIIKKHEGHIDVKSIEGEGSTFIVYLPASKQKIITRKKPQKNKIKKGGRILLMDDEEMILEVGKKILNHLGFDVELAKNGEFAIELYKNALSAKQPFHVVIMDLTIPGGMGGKETVRILKEYDPNVIAIVSSGYSNDPVMANYKAYGFSDVIIKPYRINDIEDVLNKVIKQ